MPQNRKAVKVLAEASGWSYDKVKWGLFNAAAESPAAETVTRALVEAIHTGTGVVHHRLTGTRVETVVVDEFYGTTAPQAKPNHRSMGAPKWPLRPCDFSGGIGAGERT